MDTTARRLPVLLIGGVLVLVLLVIAVWATVSAASGSDGGPVQTFRLAGDGRATTAVRITQAGWPDGAETVYLLPEGDPLTATAAGLSGGPVLVAPCAPLEPPIAQEISRLAPRNVIAIGGNSAVCDEVLRQARDFAAS